MSPGAGEAPPLGHRPNEPEPGKDSLRHPQGHADGDGGGKGVCPDCGLPFGEHPDYHMHGADGAAPMDLPGSGLDPAELGGDPAET
jgi:hypothetical protein